ncbi:MAG: T9SS type A sorting domain-containing protein [Bacteroidia bacterium]|nr:T9SS type A sorting domain-containing protein [Bacteroidia bacterium]
MKRILLIAALFSSAKLASAQTYLYENFNSYDGTAATVPSGWYFSKQGNYTNNSSAGPSTANSFKFGADGVYIVSPMIMNGDSISFYMKLNGTGNAGNDTLSTITVSGSSSDTAASSFSVLATYKKIPTTAPLRRYSVARGSNMYIKISYAKVGGNVALDDFAAFSGTFVGTAQNLIKNNFEFEVFPNPTTNGFINVKAEGLSKDASLTIFDMVGKQVVNRPLEASGRFLLDLTDMPKGLYLLQIKNNDQKEVRKIRIE